MTCVIQTRSIIDRMRVNQVFLLKNFHILKKKAIKSSLAFPPSRKALVNMISEHEIKKESTHGSHVILLTCY